MGNTVFIEWLFGTPTGIHEKQALSRLLGTRPIAYDEETGRLDVEFDVPSDFGNFAGHIHGGIISTLLDEASCLSAMCSFDDTRFRGTAESKTSYLRSVRPGRVLARAKPLRIGRTLLFMECELSDPQGRMCAKSSSTLSLSDADVPSSG
jgi:uncharacterized protein (TIGR00369 family)